MKKETKREIIIAIPFWGSIITLGIEYGWILPVALFLIILSVFMQITNKYNLDKKSYEQTRMEKSKADKTRGSRR